MDQELGSLHGHASGDWAPPVDAPSGDDVLGDVLRIARDPVGDRLQAAYALGSLAHGGFSPVVSDVDVALVLADPVLPSDQEAMRDIADTVRSMGSELHSRVSIFWGTPDSLAGRTRAGRFPPLDRLCLLEHGRLLTGEDVRSALPRPTERDLLRAGARFALDTLADDVVAHARRPELLVAAGVRWTTKIVLFPVRFLFTAETGREGTNGAAARHHVTRSEAPGAALVTAALAWRTDPPDPQEAIEMIRDELVPLYEYYLSDHIRRLESDGDTGTAGVFRAWRSRLLAAG